MEIQRAVVIPEDALDAIFNYRSKPAWPRLIVATTSPIQLTYSEANHTDQLFNLRTRRTNFWTSSAYGACEFESSATSGATQLLSP